MTDDTLILQKILDVQSKLKAPKGQVNDFGHYKYRSCEDILEALKPHLKEAGLTLVISDELVMIGDRYYIKATARVAIGKSHIDVHAYAREEESKKGMDASQITGSASSYARKYALNGMFAIDDTADADTQDNRAIAKARDEKVKEGLLEMAALDDKEPAGQMQKGTIYNLLKRTGTEDTPDAIKGTLLLEHGVDPNNMTKEQARKIIAQLQIKARKQNSATT